MIIQENFDLLANSFAWFFCMLLIIQGFLFLMGLAN